MFCKNCGKEVSSEADFCKNCGEATEGGSLKKKLHTTTKKAYSVVKIITAVIISFIVLGIAVKILQPSIKLLTIIFFGFFGFSGDEPTANADAIGNIFGLVGAFYLAQKTYRSIVKK